MGLHMVHKTKQVHLAAIGVFKEGEPNVFTTLLSSKTLSINLLLSMDNGQDHFDLRNTK